MKKIKWTGAQNEEIILAYFTTRKKIIPITKETLDIWRKRNPLMCPEMTALKLSYQRRHVLKTMISGKIREIQKTNQ